MSSPSTSQRIVVVGASLGGLRTADALRASGWDGQICVVGAEAHMPYNRPHLSKSVVPDHDVARIALRLKASTVDIDWRLDTVVEHCRPDEGALRLASGEVLTFDGLVIATGVSARRAQFPGESPPRVSIRSFDDYLRYRELLATARHVVCLGAGFIGCEVAGSAAADGIKVTVVDVAAAPLERVLGAEVGNAIARRHEAQGVTFRMNTSITGATAQSLHCSDGTELQCDLVVEAIGTVPNTDWIESDDADLSDGVLCDNAMRVHGHERVVAVGDVARFPNPLIDDVPRRVEHWNMVGETARRAAASLLEDLGYAPADHSPFAPLPSFWSDQVVVRIQSFGVLAGADDIVLLEGDPMGKAAYGYYRDGKVAGIALLDLANRAAHYRNFLTAEMVA
jgi:3-phenylpropionate/trans-cinnamate dioxygenase ferredoxin reductase component